MTLLNGASLHPTCYTDQLKTLKHTVYEHVSRFQILKNWKKTSVHAKWLGTYEHSKTSCHRYYTPVHLIKSVRNCQLCMRRCLAFSSYSHVMHCPLVITRVLLWRQRNTFNYAQCKLPSLPLSWRGYDFLPTQRGEQEYSNSLTKQE